MHVAYKHRLLTWQDTLYASSLSGVVGWYSSSTSRRSPGGTVPPGGRTASAVWRPRSQV
jgi:hypothetical protein